jgi:hypothetical protein
MLLSDMRTMLRGWLQDKIPSGGVDTDRQWTNVNLRWFINLGLREAQKIILAVDPEAFKCTYIASITVPATGVDALVEWPAGTWAVIEVATSADGVNYVPINRVTLKNARTLATQPGGGFIPYSKSHFMLAPSPTVAVPAGLRVIVAPTLVMAVDTDECPIPVAHETLVLKCAQKYALMDVGEPTDKLEAEIAALEQRVPRFYLTAHEPAFVEPMGYDGVDYELD